jgi:branched-chain amino acid transport system substrate-binding protein
MTRTMTRKYTQQSIIALTTSIAFATLSTAFAAPEPIVLGVAFHLTGNLASLDVPAYNGAKLAVQELNAKGGVLGRPLKLVVEDTASDLKRIPAAAKRLMGQNPVALLGYTDTDAVKAFVPFSESAKLPFVVVGGTSPDLSGSGKRVFLEPFGDNTQAAVGAEFARSSLGAKTVYLLEDTSNTYTTGLIKYFKDAFEHGGGKVGRKDTYTSGAKDFSSQIANIKALKPAADLLYVSALPDDIVNIVRAVRAAGIDTPIMGGDGYDTPDLLSKGGKSAENVFYTTHILLDPENGNSRAKDFIGKYKTQYQKLPENAFAALGYDSVRLIANALMRAKSTDNDALFKSLANTQGYDQITGSITFGSGVHIPSKAVTMVAVQRGQLNLAGEYTASYVPKP